METAQPSRQRSPWLYVLLGCGGLALVLCLGIGAFLFFVGKQVQSVQEGAVDPQERQRNAVEQLGAIPPGYNVVASFSMFGVMKATQLTDRPLLPDGGVELGGRLFSYSRVMANDNNAQVKAYFKGENPDGSGLRALGVDLSETTVVKRGQLSIDERTFAYLVVSGQLRMAQGSVDGLSTLVLFECPDDALRFGLWMGFEDRYDGGDAALAGTVGDEAQLAPFLRPMNPCGR